MPGRVNDDKRLNEPPKADRSERARQRGGGPNKPPSANAGDVGLGAADENKAPRKPGSEV
jgi:hypothetical protein